MVLNDIVMSPPFFVQQRLSAVEIIRQLSVDHRHEMALRGSQTFAYSLTKLFVALAVCPFAPRRASMRRAGKARGLFERSEFPRAPSAVATRRRKRGTGGFFCLLFFHAKEK